MQSSRANDIGGHRDVSVTKTAILEVDRTANDLHNANDPGSEMVGLAIKEGNVRTHEFGQWIFSKNVQ